VGKLDTEGPPLLGNPVQLLYDLIPLPDTASVLEVHGNNIDLFSPGCTRFKNVESRSIRISAATGPTATSVDVEFPEDKNYDLVVIHGVLDMIGRSAGCNSCKRSQDEFLAKAYAHLNDGGILAITVDNRFSIAAAMVKFKRIFLYASRKQGHELGRRHWSYWSLRNALKEKGFRRLKIYNVLPDYQEPSCWISTNLVPSKDYFIKESVRQGDRQNAIKSFVYQWLAKTGTMRYFEACFLVWAEK